MKKLIPMILLSALAACNGGEQKETKTALTYVKTRKCDTVAVASVSAPPIPTRV